MNPKHYYIYVSMSIETTLENDASLDFNSVQRGNPEIERRAQEVIDRCWQLGDKNPIISIHTGYGAASGQTPRCRQYLAERIGRGRMNRSCQRFGNYLLRTQ